MATHFSDGVAVGQAGFGPTEVRSLPPLLVTSYGTAGFGLAPSCYIDLGTPAALAATAICAAQAIAGAGNALINGTKASGGTVTIESGIPFFGRAVSVVSSGAGDTTQTVTVTGTDIYGAAMTQTLTLNGTTTVNGTKAFKTITQVAVSAALAGNLSVGDTDIIGIPFRCVNRSVVQTFWDTAFVTTGTFVAAVATTPSATTGDVRGTFVPPAATNGSRRLVLWFNFPYTYADTVASIIGPVQA
jgi:hypothetical protein